MKSLFLLTQFVSHLDFSVIIQKPNVLPLYWIHLPCLYPTTKEKNYFEKYENCKILGFSQRSPSCCQYLIFFFLSCPLRRYSWFSCLAFDFIVASKHSLILVYRVVITSYSHCYPCQDPRMPQQFKNPKLKLWQGNFLFFKSEMKIFSP